MRSLHHYRMYHAHHTHRISHPDFWLYEGAVWLNAFASSLISIFLPVLMFKAGYSIQLIVLYYFLFNLIDVPLNFLARRCVQLIGARRTIIAGTASAVAFFAIFYRLQESGVHLELLVLLACFAALADTLYWVAHLYLFMSSDTSSARSGKDTGILYAVRQSAVMIGPMIGAAVLLFLSKEVLLAIVAGMFALSLVPLFFMRHVSERPDEGEHALQETLVWHGGGRPIAAKLLWNIHDSVEGTLFPLFIFTIFGSLASVAVIPVLLSVAAGLVALFLGNMKRERRRAAVIAGASAIALLWIGRIAFANPIFYYASILAVGFFAYLVLVPLDSDIFEYGRRSGHALAASTLRNAADMGSNAVLYGVLLLSLSIFPTSFAIALVGLTSLLIVYALWGRVSRA